ncbi:uncharacterized protein LOC131026857 [Cryptomeria japonica]|uniref:uncharacterized protein LOC131026857 n=1 Tax=Cryptomeria japonica TaxID=3369 RepID=UPI0025AD0F5D|nr:uncharacterized protein LOC131026857 [Cryptomeria japonica]
MKKWFGGLISEEQSGFVEVRQILDGVVIATKTIHSMATFKEKAMFIKLDMAKAYDRVRWGLRQGDPLSLYLFILLAKGLGRLIKYDVGMGIIHGWSWGNDVPPLSHLQFVDDTTLMGVSRISEAINLSKVLDVYVVGSGQLINEEKYSIFFFNTSGPIQLRIAHILRFQVGSLPLTYLGIPISTGNPLRESWQCILDKFHMKVEYWTNRWLSFVGRVQLIKSVVISLLTYRGMLQVAPMWFVKELDSLARQFLWAGNLSSSKWCLVKWDLRFLEAGWSRVSDFEMDYRCGQLEMVQWKVPDEWSVVGLDEDCA